MSSYENDYLPLWEMNKGKMNIKALKKANENDKALKKANKNNKALMKANENDKTLIKATWDKRFFEMFDYVYDDMKVEIMWKCLSVCMKARKDFRVPNYMNDEMNHN